MVSSSLSATDLRFWSRETNKRVHGGECKKKKPPKIIWLASLLSNEIFMCGTEEIRLLVKYQFSFFVNLK
jgi:hypothetical protein